MGRTLFDNIEYVPTVNYSLNDDDLFILISNNYAIAFDKVIYSADLKKLTNILENEIKELNKKYQYAENFKTFRDRENKLIAYKGYWYDGELHWFYESGIIRANKY